MILARCPSDSSMLEATTLSRLCSARPWEQARRRKVGCDHRQPLVKPLLPVAKRVGLPTMEQTVRLKVNGKEQELTIPTQRLLVDCLRYDLGLTGTKEGCSVGVCGACTVLLDGKMVASCISLAVAAEGAEITTIEGLAQDERLHPVQQSFIDYGGFQCGICTPGQVMAAKALLDENPDPTEAEIKDWMMGNLCRCTGYYKILESIVKAIGPSKRVGR